MSWEIKDESRQSFVEYLRRIVTDDEEFAKFRRDFNIRFVIEGVSYPAAEAYLNKIKDLDHSWFDQNVNEIVRNELVGDPTIHKFSGIESAAVTLRYVWNALEMDRKFDLKGKSIIEIGGGYGGLARLTCALFEPFSYSIIDIPEMQSVATKFLSSLDIDAKMLPLKHEGSFDVFVANYSFAEFDREEQKKYLRNVILRSRMGYLTHNVPSPSSNQLTREEILATLETKFRVESYIEGMNRCEKSVVYVCHEK